MNWQLSRPEPALPSSYFWTWDHSTNWVLDDPGVLNFGCANRYLKRPETYVEDYRRLTDFAAVLGVKGIVIWGFLRDSHGGIEFAKRVADHAASKGVAIMPGVGLTWYGGVYYEGDHPYNLDTFLREYPDAALVTESGQPMPSGEAGACPLHPAFQDWLNEGLDWLFREFSVGGANLENGDFVVCHCPRCREHKTAWPKDDPDFFRMQALAYLPALEFLQDHLREKLVTWATYTSFSFGLPQQFPNNRWPSMGDRAPTLVDRVPAESIAQWTLTGVVRSPVLPLTAYLDDGSPEAALDNEYWPAQLHPPTRRSVGYLHQGSQWTRRGPAGRYQQVISTIKEGCLRAYRAGMEGVSIQGELTRRYVPWALNYLAFSHFIHWPEDSLRDFGRKTLGKVLQSEEEGEAFVEALAHWDAGSLTDSHRRDIRSRAGALRTSISRGAVEDLERMHFWSWLERMAAGMADPHTASSF